MVPKLFERSKGKRGQYSGFSIPVPCKTKKKKQTKKNNNKKKKKKKKKNNNNKKQNKKTNKQKKNKKKNNVTLASESYTADFCIYKAWILNACVLHDTGLEFCQGTVGSIKRIVHMYIPKGKTKQIHTQLAIN